jgi:DNA-binding CsgD family transcriptional regulator/tetratricopeptide (TPR) repeat protein
MIDQDVATTATDGLTSTAAVQALLSAGKVGEALELARTQLAKARPRSAVALRLQVAIAWILVMSGEPQRAVSLADDLALDTRLPAELGTAVELVRVMGAISLGDLPRARDLAQEILADGERRDGDVAAALLACAFSAWDGGRVADAIGLLRAAVRRSDLCDVELFRVYPRLRLVAALTAIGEVDEAEAVLRDTGNEIMWSGDSLWGAGPAARRAELRLAQGRLQDAAEAAQVTLPSADGRGSGFFVSSGETVLASVALLRGKIDVAAKHLERARSVEPANRTSVGSGTLAWLAARVAEARGDEVGVTRALDAVGGHLSSHARLLVDEPAAAAWLVRRALADGDRRGAEGIVARAVQLSLANPEFASLAASALHARGLIDGDVELLIQAAADHRQPWARGSALEDAGVLLLAGDQRDAAGAKLELARVAYEEAGADRDAARVRRRIANGSRSRGRQARPLTGWESLTDAERRVAAVVSEGLTNAAAADRLYLSRHTVDFHLRQIFRKLAIRSRVELVRVVLEHAAV